MLPLFLHYKWITRKNINKRCECTCNVPDVFHLSRHCHRPQMSERLLDVENEAMLKIVELEKQLMQTNKELDHIRVRSQINTYFLSWKQRKTNEQKCNCADWPLPKINCFCPIRLLVFCAGGLCQCELSGSHTATNGSRERPDNSPTKPSRTPSSRGPADWGSWSSSTTKRRR